MFGVDAKLAVLSARNPPQLANEQDLLQEMLRKLGPYCSESLILFHIRNSKGKLHWAVNSYFREVLTNANGGEYDYERKISVPSSVASTSAAGASDEVSCCSIEPSSISIETFPIGVIEEILHYLDAPSLHRASLVCKTLRKAALANTLWEALYKSRWGTVTFPVGLGSQRIVPALGDKQQDQPTDACSDQRSPAGKLNSELSCTSSGPCILSAGVNRNEAGPLPSIVAKVIDAQQVLLASPSQTRASKSKPTGSPVNNGLCAEQCGSCWRERYRVQLEYQLSMRCPTCGGSKLVPIVYGFPSPPLLAGMRHHKLILGGDHLIENCHVWACTQCNSSYRHYPYCNVELWLNEHIARSSKPSTSTLPTYTYEL